MAKGKFLFGFKKLSPLPNEVQNDHNKPRPQISQPVGPIKNSRGPDFTRSETLIVVGAIQDCQFTAKRDTKSTSLKMARRISSSFVKEGVLLPNTKIANTKLSTEPADEATQGARRLSISSLMAKPKLPISVSTNILQIRRKPVARSDADGKPRSHAPSNPPVALKSFVTRLPRSQSSKDVLNVHPHPTVALKLVVKPHYQDSPIERSCVSQVNLDTSSTISTLGSPTESRTQISQSSMSSIDLSMQSTPQSSCFHEIDSAQPSKYWTGRFMSLEDRLSAEKLPSSLDNRQNIPSHGSFIPGIRVKDGRIRSGSDQERDGDSGRRQRVFEYLDSLCTSTDAKLSLRTWQETYATRTNQPDLHPDYEATARRGLVSRMIPKTTNKKRQADRRSRDFLDEIYYGNASNAFGLTNAYGINGRYLTFR